MIRKTTLFFALTVLLSVAMIGFAQTGTFSGTVVDGEGEAVAGAEVALFEDGGCGGGGGGMGGGGGGMSEPLYETVTLEDGSFIIENVEAGEYHARAHYDGLGGDSEDIEIIAGETLVVDFILDGCAGGGGGGGWSNLETIELAGTAIVEESSMMNNLYYIDVDGDEEPDYQLNFGPPWYDPGSGAERPENGDEIEIVGGYNESCLNEMVIVYEINGLFWREPFGTQPGDLRRLRERHNQSDSGQNGIKVEMSSHPNPFNPETTISYTLSDAAVVDIAIYNGIGQKVATLFNGNQSAGAHQVQWMANNMSSGFYFVQMNVMGQTYTQKLMLTK